MKTIFTTLLLISTFLVSYAQHSIQGKVVDDQNLALPYANIILHQIGSTNTPKGTVSDDNGNYNFSNIKEADYIIEVSMLGFKTKKSKQFTLKTNQTFNFTLVEESQTLNEVVIKAKRPVIRQTAEKLIVDLEKSSLPNANLQDVMKRVPGMIVSRNGVSFAGRNDVRILINGKTTDYMNMDTLLRDLPADNIAKVELVEQPGAEFDAEGSGPILNIILKKNVNLGTHGSVTTWAGEDNGFEYGASASVASYKNKLNWQLSAGHSSPTWLETLYIKREVNGTTYIQDTEEPYNPKSLRFNGALDYYINDEQSIGFSIRRSTTNSDRVSNSEINEITASSTTNLLSKNSFDRDQTIFNINPYYEFKNEKHKFVADFNYVDYSNNNINDLFQTGGSQTFTNLRYKQDGSYKIKTYKADYNRMFNDNLKLSFGTKLSQVNTNNDLESYEQNISNGFDLITDQSNRFLIDEDIFAIYSKINATIGKWSFSGGLRYENSNTKGTAIAYGTNDGETRDRKISKLFPSVSVSRKLNEKLGASLSYSYRLRRPSYNTLNSFATYYDPLTAEVGNPNLKPAFTNNYQFNLTFDGQPFFTVGYSDTKDALFLLITQDDAQIQRSTINLSERKNWNFRLFAPVNFAKGLEGYTGIIVNHNKFQSRNLPVDLLMKKWNLTWFTQVNYELPWDIDFEFSGYYGTGALEGQIEVDWLADLDFSFSKKFMNDRLRAGLSFNNMINRPFTGKVNYDDINADIISNQSRYNIQLRLTYSFGSKFGKNKNRSNSSREEEDRINDNN